MDEYVNERKDKEKRAEMKENDIQLEKVGWRKQR